MIKVFLVEDEYVIREGIKKNIDWKAHGYEFCGEAGDGELAFPMIQEIRPDIVITDIRMPFMDGLALSRLIKKEFPETEIIILSGYEEFEYAKEGIKIGVAQYLLKPISGDALIKEIDLVASSIEERKQKERIRERYFKQSMDLESEKDNLNIQELDYKQFEKSRLQEFMKVGHKEEVPYFIDEMFEKLDHSAVKSRIFRQYIVMDAYFCVAEFVESIGLSREEVEPMDVASDALSSIEYSKEYIVRIIRKAIDERDQVSGNKYKNLMDDVKAYIEEHYVEEDLTLNQLAAHVNFSPNHFSTIFSQQTGQPFIKYLTDFRMNKAKELLRCTGKKSSEIGLEVGYKDPHYFSALFRKTQGMTPTQYREGKA